MRVALLVRKCKVCMNSGIACIDMSRLQVCLRLRGGAPLIASLVKTIQSKYALSINTYNAYLHFLAIGKNAFHMLFKRNLLALILPCFPCFPYFPSYIISCYLFARITW